MAATTRRERVRDATTAEIKATARSLLVTDGPGGVTLRATARAMGLSAPALYRYVASHEDLLHGLVADLLTELTETLEAARDTVGDDDPVGRLMAICREFRRWSLAHPREFQLLFASTAEGPLPGHGGPPGSELSFGAVFLGVFVEIWHHRPFASPPTDALPPGLVSQLQAFSTGASAAMPSAATLPLGVLMAYLSGWVRLYGAVTIEVFGHLGFALSDAGPMFEAMLADMRRQLTTPPAEAWPRAHETSPDPRT